MRIKRIEASSIIKRNKQILKNYKCKLIKARSTSRNSIRFARKSQDQKHHVLNVKTNVISFRYSNSKDNLRTPKSKGQIVSNSLKRLVNFHPQNKWLNINSKPWIIDESNMNKN